jgi:imidazolonepropionase-like amidohydrolase
VSLLTHASDSVPGSAALDAIALVNAEIHPVSGPVIPRGSILFERGKILAIGPDIAIPNGTNQVDLGGKQVYPGLIAANTTLGLTEVDSVRGSDDTTETGQFNPNARAEVSINPDSELIPVARSNGILAALSVPQASDDKKILFDAVVTGQSALIELDGWTWEQMTLKAPVGLHIRWGRQDLYREPDYPFALDDPEKKQVVKSLRTPQDFFEAARAYMKMKESSGCKIDLHFEAIIPVLKRQVPVMIYANTLEEIDTALRWTEKEDLRMILVGGADAWRLLDRLKQRGVPVIFTRIYDVPERRTDGFDIYYRSPAMFAAAGVSFCIASNGDFLEATSERNVPYMAAMAVAHGLSPEEGIKAITLYPAQILGVGDRLGSLEVGKDATLIVTTGNPLQVTSQVEMAWIEGRPVDLSNRQTRLRDKYQRKYEQAQ